MSKCNIGYSYNGTDETNAIYTAIPNGSTVWFNVNGNTKVGQELGLSQQYEGAEIIMWKGSDWRGGALAISGDGSPVMIGQNNGSNSIKWNPLALKDDLETRVYYETNDNGFYMQLRPDNNHRIQFQTYKDGSKFAITTCENDVWSGPFIVNKS